MLRSIVRLNKKGAAVARTFAGRSVPALNTSSLLAARTGMGAQGRSYHTYPDADDKGVETKTLAKDLSIDRQIKDKSGDGFILDE